ncbi:MAG: hypothetical protein ACYC1C_06490 [Chloroflexota bacterium]
MEGTTLALTFIPFLLFGSLSLIPTIVLLIVGWRIMRAQEEVAAALRDMANQPPR